jgi:glycine/D-amino acid oxidase-like deaminating enzyme
MEKALLIGHLDWNKMNYENEFDLVIVGAGIVGLMTAVLAIIRKPTISIAMIDKNMVGFGASAYSAALSTLLSKSTISKELLHNGQAIIQEIEKYIQLDLVIKPSIYVINKPDVNKFLNLYVGSNLNHYTHNVINTSLGSIRIPNNKQLFISNNDSHFVNLYELMNKIYLFLRMHACTIYESCHINEIINNENSTTIVSENLKIKARKVVLCLGPWEYNSSLTEKRELESNNKKITAIHLNKIPSKEDPVIMLLNEDAFLLPLEKRGQWLFSITSTEWGVTPDMPLNISNNDIKIAENILTNFNLSLNNLYSGGRVFCDSYSPDKEFQLEIVQKNVISVTGASGSGYRFSYGIANKIFEMINQG